MGIAHTLAARGADRLWRDLHADAYVNALGAMTGNQAVQTNGADAPRERHLSRV